MAERSDEELLRAAGTGDRSAFGLLVERHHRAVLQFAYRFLADVDRDTAEDLAQDVFLKAWQAAPGFEPRAAVLTWLLRIATNTCLNHRRRSRLRRTLSLASGGLLAADPRGGPADAPAAGDESRRVRIAVAGLPAGQRAAVVLRHFHELSYSDIAQVLDTSISAVESLLFRARRTLEQRLHTQENGGRSPQVLSREGAEQG